jgi:hypothetical protein
VRVLFKLISIVIKLLILGALWVVYLPISVIDFLWVHLVDPTETNKRQEAITY